MTMMFYKELNINPELLILKSIRVLSVEDHRKFQILPLKGPRNYKRFEMGYSFVFPEKHGYLSIELSNNAVTNITEKTALGEAVLIVFIRSYHNYLLRKRLIKSHEKDRLGIMKLAELIMILMIYHKRRI